jgi:hypothetical protein
LFVCRCRFADYGYLEESRRTKAVKRMALGESEGDGWRQWLVPLA